MKLKHQTGEYYGITKEQILNLKDGFSTEKKLREMFPNQEIWEAEKPKLEINRWYFFLKDLIYITKVTEKTVYAYGFDDGEWVDNDSIHIDNDFIPATDQEVQDALEKEARKRGFVYNVRFAEIKDSDNDGTNSTRHGKIGHAFRYKNGNLYSIGYGVWCLFKDGKWATPEETITKQEAEKLILEKTGINKKIID